MSEKDRDESKKVDIRRGKRVRRNSPARPRRCVEAHSSYSSTYDIEQSYAILDQLGMSSRKIYSRQLLIGQGSSSSNPGSYQTQFTSANIHRERDFSVSPQHEQILEENVPNPPCNETHTRKYTCPLDLGAPDHLCNYCGAYYWHAEKSSTTSTVKNPRYNLF